MKDISQWLEEDMNGSNNKIKTTNGDLQFFHTLNFNLDMFASAATYRDKLNEFENLFDKAYIESPRLSVKNLFYIRDIYEGLGERDIFRVGLRRLTFLNKDLARYAMQYIPEFGRWDDLYAFRGTSLEDDMIQMINHQLINDYKESIKYKNDNTYKPNISLLAKWLKSENSSSKLSKEYAIWTAKKLNLNMKDYRKILSQIRSSLKIIENYLCKKEYDKIIFEHVPAKASIKYARCFYKNMEVEYKNYIESLKNNKTKINVNGIYPYDILKNVLFNENDTINDQLEEQWKNIPDFLDKAENSMCIVDTSGSMEGKPILIAISLALYISEKNTHPSWHNKFITFSEDPQFNNIEGSTLKQKYLNMCNSDWGMNTNIEKVFNIILSSALKHNVSSEDMLEKLYILTDMQFDSATSNNNKSVFENVKEKFESHGYKLPDLIFWNVSSFSTFPVKKDEINTYLVNGYSPAILKYLKDIKNNTPSDLMSNVLNSGRYDKVVPDIYFMNGKLPTEMSDEEMDFFLNDHFDNQTKEQLRNVVDNLYEK